jgi:putative transposase
MYQIRRVNIGKTAQLDALARECGRLYSQTLVSFWRTVRHKGIWLKPKHLMRWYPSEKLHAHTADACVQAFFASLKSWRERKKAGCGFPMVVATNHWSSSGPGNCLLWW